MVVASLILAGSLGVGGWDGWRNARAFDWITVKPVSWLMRDATGNDAPKSAAALAELDRRLRGDLLTDVQVDDLVETALDIQGDVAIVWDPTWGDIIEDAWRENHVDQEQIARYFRQMIEPGLTFETSEFMSVNGHLVQRLAWNPIRSVPFSDFTLIVEPERIRFPDGRRVGGTGGGEFRINAGATTLTSQIDVDPGTYELSLDVTFKVTDRGAPPRATLMEFATVLTSTTTVLEDYEPPVELLDDPKMYEAVRASLSVHSVQIVNRGGEAPRIDAQVSCTAPPINLALKIWMRIGDVEIPALGSVTAGLGDMTGYHGRFEGDDDAKIPADLTQVDFVLRPDVEAARIQPPPFEPIYGGPEIVIENVPVTVRPG